MGPHEAGTFSVWLTDVSSMTKMVSEHIFVAPHIFVAWINGLAPPSILAASIQNMWRHTDRLFSTNGE